MFTKLFGKKHQESSLQEKPAIMGLHLGGSFEIDPLLLKLTENELIIEDSCSTHIIKSAGIVDLDGSWLFRFYTDDDAFLQVIADGGKEDEHVVDVKLFHFYDTQDVPTKKIWDELLNERIGTPTYQLEGHDFQRVWTSASPYHNPVHMCEKTYEQGDDECSETDQFTMLFERPLSGDLTESLFLSAEETVESGCLTRCFVLSTGITLTPAQLTIHG